MRDVILKPSEMPTDKGKLSITVILEKAHIYGTGKKVKKKQQNQRNNTHAHHPT